MPYLLHIGPANHAYIHRFRGVWWKVELTLVLVG